MKKVLQSIRRKIYDTSNKTAAVLMSKRGEIATNTIGGIIIGVVIVGLLIIAINSFFPGFFQSMFAKMQSKLDANW